MIDWYNNIDDEYIRIRFDKEPHIDSNFPRPGTSKKDKKKAAMLPYELKEDLYTELDDLGKECTYAFTIPKGYRWDGASIPKWLKYTAGVNTDPRFTIPSLIHDYLCEHHDLVDGDRYFADRVFEKLMDVSGVHPFKRWYMFHTMDNYQKFQGWDKC